MKPRIFGHVVRIDQMVLEDGEVGGVGKRVVRAVLLLEKK